MGREIQGGDEEVMNGEAQALALALALALHGTGKGGGGSCHQPANCPLPTSWVRATALPVALSQDLSGKNC